MKEMVGTFETAPGARRTFTVASILVLVTSVCTGSFCYLEYTGSFCLKDSQYIRLFCTYFFINRKMIRFNNG